MLRRSCLALALAVSLCLTSCYTMTHQVGTGGSGGPTTEERQWWALWGLVPINSVDSHTLAGNRQNYTVTTQFTPLDVLISFFTGFVTVHVQTIKVEG
jgi:hypothetical protein